MRTLAAFLVVAHAFVSPGRRLLAPRRLAAPTSNEGCEVYVGNIARQTDEQALREAFEELDLLVRFILLLVRHSRQLHALVDGLSPIRVLQQEDDAKLAATNREARLELVPLGLGLL